MFRSKVQFKGMTVAQITKAAERLTLRHPNNVMTLVRKYGARCWLPSPYAFVTAIVFQNE